MHCNINTSCGDYYSKTLFPRLYTMAQFVRNNILDINAALRTLTQVSQIVYNGDRIIEINWDYYLNRVIVVDNGAWFYLSSPDINRLTHMDVIEYLGYADDYIYVTWAENSQENFILDSPIENLILNQINILPQHHSLSR